MRRLILLALASAVSLILLLSFASSFTGLFYLPSKIPEEKTDAAEETDETYEKAGKWKFFGNVSVSKGGLTELGT